MPTNDKMRTVLREIEATIVNALTHQPTDEIENGRHLNKALAVVEVKAHVARWGQEGYPARETIAENGEAQNTEGGAA